MEIEIDTSLFYDLYNLALIWQRRLCAAHEKVFYDIYRNVHNTHSLTGLLTFC